MATYGELGAWQYFIVLEEDSSSREHTIYYKLPSGKAWKYRGARWNVNLFYIDDIDFLDSCEVLKLEAPVVG